MFAGFVTLEGTLVGTVLVEDSTPSPINSDAVPTYRVYGPNGLVESGSTSLRDSGSVTNATNATPIVITSSSHGLTTGTVVTVADVEGNTAANGTFTVTKVDDNTFSLDGSAGSGPWTVGGTWNTTGVYKYTLAASGTTGYEQGESYQMLFAYQISSTDTAQLHTIIVE